MLTEFFSCDWGTTSFRLRRADAATGKVLAERREPSGIRTLLAQCPSNDRAQREKVFASFLRDQMLSLASSSPASLDGAAVLVSGMASSSVGWRELPYARVPVGLDGSRLVREQLELPLGGNATARVWLISGVCTHSDIMRGEETEILGLFTDGEPAERVEEALLVLPGTHSKHVRLEARQIAGFRTYMTGELFDVLSKQSLLRASVEVTSSSAALLDPGPREAFAAGVRYASQHGLAAGLFQTRVRTVLQHVPPAVNGWFLSGLLIGAEASDTRQTAGPILLAAPEPLKTAYRVAFETLDLIHRLTVLPLETINFASVRGHCAILRHIGRAGGGGSAGETGARPTLTPTS